MGESDLSCLWGWAIDCLTGELQSGGTFFLLGSLGILGCSVEDHTILGFDPL